MLSAKLVELYRQGEPRRFTGPQKAELAQLLRGPKVGLTIVSPLTDGEASDFADDFDSAVIGANWQTLRIRNVITKKYGVALVTAEGTPPLSSLKALDSALKKIGVSHSIETMKN